jgi:hypothetical protein
LKALILSVVPTSGRKAQIDSFRGAKAHDFEWLKREYRRRGGANLPAHVAQDFTTVNTWTTDLRYKPGTLELSEAEAFLESARNILGWGKGRF